MIWAGDIVQASKAWINDRTFTIQFQCLASRELRLIGRLRGSLKKRCPSWGTEGSNPSSSSEESAANPESLIRLS
jgi:hypothetical protein